MLKKRENEYHIVSLTSRIEYLPQNGYYESGDYHNGSQDYPVNFAFTLKPTDIGILPLEQPRNSKDENAIFEYKKEMTIFVTVQLSKRYDSKNRCHSEKTPNRYGPSYDETWSCDADDNLYGCYSFYFHKDLCEHTADLVHSKIPKVKIEDSEDDSTLDSTFDCPVVKDSSVAFGNATFQNVEVNAPCHSRLYFHSKHATDPGLIKMLDKETRKMIQGRLFILGMCFIAICSLYVLYGSFRGSLEAIHIFERNDGRSDRSFTERESTESQRLVRDGDY